MFCTACGAKVNEGQDFCTTCGARLKLPATRPPEIPRPVPVAVAKKSSLSTGAIVAIIVGAFVLFAGIISAIVIPNLLIVRQKANLKTAASDVRQIAMALNDYITDNAQVPDQNGSYNNNSAFYEALAPFYLKVLPSKNPWGHDYHVYCGPACNGEYGISGAGEIDFLVVSLGKDGIKDDWKYDPGNPGAGFLAMDSLDDFDRDLIWYTGDWIRAPLEYR